MRVNSSISLKQIDFATGYYSKSLNAHIVSMNQPAPVVHNLNNNAIMAIIFLRNNSKN